MTVADLQPSGGTEDPMPHTPGISLLLAYAAMLPVVAGTVWCLVWSLGRHDGVSLPVRLTVGWAGAVLCFLAGVRRGLAFRQPGGPTLRQLATMFSLFVLGALSLLSPWPLVAVLLQVAGYGTMAVADPDAARRREVPVYFRRLRPVQMMVPVVSLAVLAACLWMNGAPVHR